MTATTVRASYAAIRASNPYGVTDAEAAAMDACVACERGTWRQAAKEHGISYSTMRVHMRGVRDAMRDLGEDPDGWRVVMLWDRVRGNR